MFLPEVYDQMHKHSGSSVALTVFAIGRFVFTLAPEHTVAAFSISQAEAQPDFATAQFQFNKASGLKFDKLV